MQEQYPFIEVEDAEVATILRGEDTRQAEGLELIPSENYVSRAVREALASSMTNKYSEGYPRHRYYGGQEYTNQLESLTIERAKKLFNADHANVQPLSGAAANVAAYFSWLEPGDTVLGMDLAHGGHLTHGSPVTYMSKLYKFVRYGMKDADTGEIDYAELAALAKREKPKIILAGFSAYPRELNWAKIAEIANEVGAVAMADVAHIAGLIAGGVAKNPLDHGFHLMTTTTHKTLRGPRGGMILTKGMIGNPLKAPEKTIENLPTLVDRAVFPGFQGGPHMHQIAGKAVALHEAAQPSFKKYAAQVIKNAKAMAQTFKDKNMRLITGGTDNHLILADVFGSLGIGGKEAEERLDQVGITLNKNAIAGDTRKPFDPSGIRFGTPAMTTRGFNEADSAQVATLMLQALTEPAAAPEVAAAIKALALAHPIPESFM